MKKTIIALSLFMAAVTGSAFAKKVDPVNARVLKTFSSEFTNASNVTWTPVGQHNLVEAKFEYNGEELHAFFNNEGELIATSRFISKSQLPIVAQKEIAKRYSNYVISGQVIENTTPDGTLYYVTLASAKNTLVVSTSGSGEISIFKKVKSQL